MPSIIIFPGQGSQFVGMGRRLLGVPKVERMFELASKVFQFDVLDLCLNGPKSELDKTSKCQVAVFVTSMGAVELLKQTNPDAVKQCYATAGFSIGEYASLVLADAIKFEDGMIKPYAVSISIALFIVAFCQLFQARNRYIFIRPSIN